RMIDENVIRARYAAVKYRRPSPGGYRTPPTIERSPLRLRAGVNPDVPCAAGEMLDGVRLEPRDKIVVRVG
ncbi:MAG: hypothetical protein ABI251_07625, partial [Mycobacteriaceae bacterium]